LVTTKGKVYTFDSIECLVDYLRKQMNSGVEAKHIMVTPFTKPGSLVEADGSWYLHSKGLPSPMGMYLTAFESEADLKSFKDENGGLSFSWDELVEKFPSLNPSLLK
jgi:copper chaperone NosL